MNESLPLRDIHLPEAVSWWPPAAGWWLLLGVAILLLAAIVWAVKYLRRPRLDKTAIDEIERLLAEHDDAKDAQVLLRSLSILLRRIGISFLPREASAGLTGKHWYQALNELTGDAVISRQSIEFLCHAPYQLEPQIDDADISRLQLEIREWVRSLPERPPNALAQPVESSHV